MNTPDDDNLKVTGRETAPGATFPGDLTTTAAAVGRGRSPNLFTDRDPFSGPLRHARHGKDPHMTAAPLAPLVLLDNVLATLLADYWLAREVALLFWNHGALDYDDVYAIWRKYWGRGLHDED